MVNRDTKLVSPGFIIPEGAADFEYREEIGTNDIEEFDVGDDVDFDVMVADDTIDDDGDTEAPGIVENIVVVNQEIRFAPDGSQVVDVYIEVDDVPNTERYEVGVAKA